MPIFDVEAGGQRFQIEAPDQAAAADALSSLPGTKPEAENSLAGSASALAGGTVSGVAGLAGLPADVADLATRGFDYMTGKKSNEIVKPYADKYGSGSMQKMAEQYTGKFAEPQTLTEKTLHTIGSFLPAAIGGPGGLIGRIATRSVIPGVASEAAGQMAEGTGYEPVARIAGALGGAVAGGKIGSMVSKPTAIAAVPTRAELEAAKSAGYKSPAISSLEINPTAVEKFTDSVIDKLKQSRISEKQAGLTYDALSGLRKPEFGTNHTLGDFDATRKILNQVAGNFANPTDAGAAKRAISAIDAFTMRVPQAAVIAGDAKAAGRELFAARQNAAAGFRSERIAQAIEKATNTAGATHSGGNIENEIRKQIRNIINSPKQRRGFNEQELDALRAVARGDVFSNSLRRVGKLLGGGGGLGQMISGGAGGAMFGWPGMVALPAAGMGAGKISSAMTMNSLNKADELIRSRSALYGKPNQAAYLKSIESSGILGSLPKADQIALQSLLASRQQSAN
mgnify:CR=1 FL=1|tara:strand:- start:1262 stop:2794 length:1533 start_codon:yes stop_codon:yes gene_type:complete